MRKPILAALMLCVGGVLGAAPAHADDVTGPMRDLEGRNPGLAERVKELLETNPGSCVLVSRAVLMDPGKPAKVLRFDRPYPLDPSRDILSPEEKALAAKVKEVRMDPLTGRIVPVQTDKASWLQTDLYVLLSTRGMSGNFDSNQFYAKADTGGVLAFVVPPGEYRFRGSGFDLKHAEDRDVQCRWPEPLKAEPNGALLLPDLEFVSPVVRLTLVDGKQYRASDKPILRWERYPGVASYRITVSCVEHDEDSSCVKTASRFSCKGSDTEAGWEQVLAGELGKVKKCSWSGMFYWQISALDDKGKILSVSHGAVLSKGKFIGTFSLVE